MGRLVATPEVKTSKGGKSYCNFTVVVNDSRKDAAGEWQDNPSYFDCTAFGYAADKAGEMDKGSPVMIEAKPQQEKWEDRETGAKRSKIVMIVDKLVKVGAPPESNGSTRSPAAVAAGGNSINDDDIPWG